MPGQNRRPLALLAVLLATAAVSAGALQDGARGGAWTPAPDDERLRGFVVPSHTVELLAPLEEIIGQIDVVEGDRVTKGQVLATMDDRLQAVVVDAARVRAEAMGAIERADVEREDAQFVFDQISAAFADNAANELEVRRAEIGVKRADAARTAALDERRLNEVNLQLEEERLARYRILAPFDGTIIELIAEAGSMLTEDDPILMMADLDTLEARIDLPIEMFGQLEEGESYTLLADPPVDRKLEWRLKQINPIIDTASRTFRCVFTMENPDAALPAGFTVRLEWPPAP